MRKSIVAALVAFLGLAGFALADVTYEEETKMGGLLKIVTFGKGVKTRTRISGDRMRTETGNEATIIDLSAEKIYNLDTKKKTYTVMSFEQMKQQMRAGASMVQGKRAEGGEEAPDTSTRAEIKVTETGRAEKIKDYHCNQYLMELDLTVTNEEEQQSGTFSTVTEIWLTKDAPGLEEIRAFQEKMAEKLGTTALGKQMTSGGGGGDNEQSRQFQANMAEMAEEMKKMDGFAMRSVFYFGDPEAAKQEARGEKKGGGFGGMFKKVKPFGGSNEEDSEESGAPGSVVMKMTTEIKKIETKSIDEKYFSVPDNYELIEAR